MSLSFRRRHTPEFFFEILLATLESTLVFEIPTPTGIPVILRISFRIFRPYSWRS